MGVRRNRHIPELNPTGLQAQTAQISTLNSLIESDEKGWLNVKKESGKIISIAKYCRVKYHGYNRDKSRELFTIVDWPNQNTKASVSAISKTKSRFDFIQYKAGGSLVFEKAKNRLKYGNSNWIHTSTDPSNPMPKGTHNLWVPDYLHEGGEGYTNVAKYATVWFRIGAEKSSRYLHVGNFSAGCVTVGEKSTGGKDADKKKWDDIYNYLVKCRSSVELVGKIKVI